MPVDTARSRSSSPRARQACLACRATKVRCLENTDRSVPCKRCARLKIVCEYTRETRGRKTNQERQRRSEVVQPATTGASDVALSWPEAHFWSQGEPPLPSFLQDDAVPRSVQPQQQLISGSDLDVNSERPLPSASPPNTAWRNASAPNLDVSEYLNPAVEVDGDDHTFRAQAVWLDVIAVPDSEKEARRPFEDPVELGFMSLREAEILVQFFHRNLNPMIALLDPHLHTTSYLRSTSSLLFTAILTAASKFHLKGLYKDLMSHGQILLNRAISASECNIGVIQSLMILVYWKSTTDRSAWMKVGMAIRMGYQLGWHVVRSGALPSDEHAARKILDAERTWFCLACFDRSYALLFNLPTTISTTELGDGRNWCQDHLRYDVQVDIHLASSVSDIPLYDAWKLLRSSHATMPKEVASIALGQHYDQLYHLMRSWYTSTRALPSLMSQGEQTYLKWNALDQMLSVKYEMIGYTRPLETLAAISSCLELASNIVDQIEAAEASDTLLYLQDVASCASSNLGIVIRKLFWRLSNSQKLLALNMIKRFQSCCGRACRGDDQAASAFVARFMTRILQRISVQSRAQTRRPTPMSDGQMEHDPISSTESMGLEAVTSILNSFLDESTLQVAGQSTLDDQYWLTLFSTGDADQANVSLFE